MPLEKCHKCDKAVGPVKEVEGWVIECCGVRVEMALFEDMIYQWNYIQGMRNDTKT